MFLDDCPTDNTYRKMRMSHFILGLFSRLDYGLVNRKNTSLTSRNAKVMDVMLKNPKYFCFQLKSCEKNFQIDIG